MPAHRDLSLEGTARGVGQMKDARGARLIVGSAADRRGGAVKRVGTRHLTHGTPAELPCACQGSRAHATLRVPGCACA
eukprot:scaffold327383_cov59-Tisochrysis_lutea.AAC.4